MFSPTPNSRPDRAAWRASVWRVVDRAVAFATLDAYGVEVPHAAVDQLEAQHDRDPLQAHRRPRRPAPAPRVQHCVAPNQARPRRRELAVSARIPSPTRGHSHS
jgi:hypothetical protein